MKGYSGRKKNRGVRIFITAALSLAALLLLLAFCGVFLLHIGYVSFSEVEHYTEEELFEASGIALGGSMYRIDKREIKARIMSECPYISSVTVRRTLPDRLVITLTEYDPKFYVEISGEYFAVLDDLTVLGKLDPKEVSGDPGLIKVSAQGLKNAVVGKPLKFSGNADKDEIRYILSEVRKSVLADRLNIINIEDKFDIYAVSDNLYKLMLGDSSDIKVKLDLGEKILEDPMFAGNVTKAKVDLSNTRECSVMVDNQLTWR